MYLWSGTLSVFSAKVRIAAAEKGLEVEIRDLPWTRANAWGEKPREFLAVSPRAEVPVLVDGELAVFDSTVINEYLEERFPDVPLMLREPAGRARCRMWEELADDMLAKALPVLVRELFLKPDGSGRDEAAVAAATEVVATHHRRLEEALAGQDFLCGACSLADIGNFLAVAFARTLGVPPAEGHQALGAWLRRVGERPAVAAEMQTIVTAAAAA